MPVGIAEVVNSTTSKITYHNLESGRQFEVQGRTRSQYDNDKLPSSEATDDTLPWYDSNRDNKHIAINVLGRDLMLSERDAKFYIYNNSGGYLYFGGLSNATKYVFRFDALRRPTGDDGLSVTVYVYADPMQSVNGEVSGSTLEAYNANAAMVLIPF